MCGRTRCTLSRECIARAAGVPQSDFVNGDKYTPIENMAPGNFTPVVYRTTSASQDAMKDDDTSDPPQQPQMRVEAMKWGLVPSFTKPHVKPDHFIMFNARSATLRERPAFRRLLESRRCVVLCDGYYEWKQIDKKEKQPFYCYRPDGAVLKFAGLYDEWTRDDGDTMRTFTMLTTDAAPSLQWLHSRMPVMLTDDGATRWASDARFATLTDLLTPDAHVELTTHPVDKRLGSTKFQSSECAKKVDINHSSDIKAFFSAHAAAPSVKREAAMKREAPRQQTTKSEAIDDVATDLTKREAGEANDSSIPSSNVDKQPTTSSSSSSSSAVASNNGFVRASSLLGKRSEPSATASPLKRSDGTAKWSSPTRASPNKKAANKKTKTSGGTPEKKKQSSLLAFLQPK